MDFDYTKYVHRTMENLSSPKVNYVTSLHNCTFAFIEL